MCSSDLCFYRASGSIVLRVEVENDFLSLEIIELHYITRSQERRELRSLHSCLDTGGRLHDFEGSIVSFMGIAH